jgi:monoamine oxidase
MIDVAIVGAGLAGLALAHRLQAEGLSIQVFDARTRTGGRILTDAPADGAAIDLGASWYWPDTEPRITALVKALGLRNFDQPDVGDVLGLTDPNAGPKALDAEGVHGGAQRLSGGTASIVNTLTAALAPDTLRLTHRLVSLRHEGKQVDLQFSHAQDGVEHVVRVSARRVVLAMPPRLIAQHVRFHPELPLSTQEALRAVSTWMAREAKAAARYAQPFWLKKGHSGNAFVNHSQAMLREVWDASDERGAALAGFSALSADMRPQFTRSMNLLVESQFTQLFGEHEEPSSIVTQDWAMEPWTCAELDLADEAPTPPMADPVLRRPHWDGSLYFGGTETARQAAGHMEGALESAARLADFLRPVAAFTEQAGDHLETALSAFSVWVDQARQSALERYRQHLNQMLARQDRENVTQRALVATVEQTYANALEELARLDVRATDMPPSGRSELTPRVLAAFSGFSKAMVEEALGFNRTSCALSNFPQEHKPDADYLRYITADLMAAWREFALATNDLLCTRSQQAVG